ncbi:MAG TPA: TraR/DksA C4-type zinc finger protein [Bryobacteraceae bacterium]|nr:TraR/DksA C4-type zinc finger protein [Bryobacteraceae bacterium]HXR14567.1 TraR/DksA C4-type zinc finger protein [Terriglobales bacterium]HZW92131.1 TraR/DksA C4-type zinc finger protein [Candidatus Eremiobacteraceae bacterium]
MEVVQLKKFKRALKAQQMVAIHNLGESREILAVEGSADEMDQTGRSAEREFAILGLNRRSELLRNIHTALRRIEDGTFGTCTNCDEAIGRNRLVAVPWTPFCIRCQEVVDRGDTRMMEPPYELDIHAA